ncbi:PREDICTED: inactive peptidyl-prolyl cis-trans isomerase shutdown-like [Papilio xuthus]|uniref:peptidylprolyl isomerase n=1 Tax=Papilio xuthus TaxID=66420 RepID=A0AAJ6ZXU4_PAPXU|nr:PREDICTED: inactive peptidyl-prolyl cis-trans isomerase shutdown-like [Papilio xuthus]
MDPTTYRVALENGLNLKEVLTRGSILHINEGYEDLDDHLEPETKARKTFEYIGQPVKSFQELKLDPVDEKGFIKKRIIEEGGGLPLNDENTVSIAYTGYWENENEPFDLVKINKPLVVDLKDNGLLPGLQLAIHSMLVGELSLFLLSYELMYGEMGIPPRIKPKADCIFYIKLIKSIITPKQGPINFSEANIFNRVHHEVKLLYSSGLTLHKTKNYMAAAQVFRKSVSMLHRCRLADEDEEKIQEKLLIKLYSNLAICYNKLKKPLQACTSCNELNRLNSLWNNSKMLFQNAKALRMIGQFSEAEKRLRSALKLQPNNEELQIELELLLQTRDSCKQITLIGRETLEPVNDNFKREVDTLIINFKNNVNLCKLTLPSGLNKDEMDYVKEACIRENLFFNVIQKNYFLDKDVFNDVKERDDPLWTSPD